MGMRRSNLIRFDGYLETCLKVLYEGVDSDYILCQLAMLQKLADDLSGQILPDDYVIISEAKAKDAYKGFEKQLKEWQEQLQGTTRSNNSLGTTPETFL